MERTANTRSFTDPVEAGRAAAVDVAAEIRSRLASQDEVRMVFAAAPSQAVLLSELAAAPEVDWRRVTAFHMDEFLGLPPDAPQRFGTWLRRTLFDHVPLGAVHFIDTGGDPSLGAAAYAALLSAAPIDIVCLGIGVNGHLAFNDPPVADFDDPLQVKPVDLDDTCRQQQVDDGLFPTLADVPTRAITLTIPRLLDAARLFCSVSGRQKREALHRALHDEPSPACPATALRRHPDCAIYADREALPDGG